MDEVVLLVPKSNTRWKLSVVVTLNQAETVISVVSEMGRTPRINNSGGRDHYGGLTSLLLAYLKTKGRSK